jgi:putative aldouronate transport system substrate-binding protein
MQMKNNSFIVGKKWFGIALSLILFASLLAACSGNNSNNGTAPSSSAAPAGDSVSASPASSSASETPAEEPVKLTIWADSFEKSFPAGVQNDAVAQEITKRTGVIMDITPQNAIADYKGKLASALASNDLPDIFLADPEIASKAISAKAVIPLDQYLEKYAPDIIKEMPQRIDYAKKNGGKDVDGKNNGQLWYLALRGDMNTDPLQAQVAPYLRYDLWKKLGFPKVETMDDYIPILKQMMTLEPKNKDGKKNYGLSGWFGDWGDWVFGAGFGMTNGVGDIGGGIRTNMGSKDLFNEQTDPNSVWWQAVEWYNKAYREGIIDPDSFTMKWDDFLQKSAAQRIFFAWAPWQADPANQAFTTAGAPDKGFVQMPVPTTKDRYFLDFDNPYGGTNYYVSAKCKNPEKAVALLNFLSSTAGAELIYNGVQGTHWDLKDGKPVIKDEVLQGLKNDPDYIIKSGVNKYHNLAGHGKSYIDPQLNAPVYFGFLPEYVKLRMTPLQSEAAKHFGVTLLSDLITKKPEIKHLFNSVVPALPSMPDDLKQIGTKMTNYIKDNELSLVIAKSEEAFKKNKEKFIADLKGLQVDKLLDWIVQELVKIDPAYKKAAA